MRDDNFLALGTKERARQEKYFRESEEQEETMTHKYSSPKIIIEVSGGIVQAVHSDDPDIDVTIIDHDNAESGDLTEEQRADYDASVLLIEGMTEVI